MIRFLGLLILCFALIQCDKSTSNELPTADNEYVETTSSSFDEFANNLNLSAANLFVELCQSDPNDQNQIISPLSIQTALALLLNGAHGNTAKELKQFLKLEHETIGGINAHFSEMSARILEVNTNKSYLDMSNAAIWNDAAMTMNRNFLDRIEQSYSADQINADFTVDGVNSWAENATDGLIKEVIQEIKADEVLFLLNALLYRGDWLAGFEESSTTKVTGQLPNGTTTEYDMMSSDYNHYFYDDEEVQAIKMKFIDEAYELVAVQPKEESLDVFITEKGGSGIADLLNVLSDEAFSYDRLDLKFPKFEVKYKRNISDPLQTLGVVDAFTDSAAKLDSLGDAPGILYVTRVLHDTYFKIDEKGVEGAAVTTVGVGTESVPPSFVFDKPFFLCLRTSANKIPIFIGKIGDPGKE